MYNYLPWPSNMRTADHVLAMRIREGSAGYGIYIMLLELLRDSNDRKLVNNPANLAFAINEPDVELVRRVLSEYDLFSLDESGRVSSPWLDSQLGEYDAKKQAAVEAGRRGAAKRYGKQLENEQEGNRVPIATLNPPLSAPHSNIINNMKPNESNQSKSKLLGMSWGDMSGEDLFNLARAARTEIDDITRQWLQGKQEELESRSGRDKYNLGALLEICDHFHLANEMLVFLIKYTNFGQVGRQPLVKLLRIYNEAKATKFMPKYPAEYVLVKLLEP